MVGLGIAGFVLQGLALIVGGTWKLSQMEQRITAEIVQHRREIDDAHTEAVGKIQTAHTATIEGLRREVGEVVSALRQKVHEVETWSRDHFVRRDSFEVVIREIRDAIKAQADNLDKRFDKIDEKLDRR